MNVFHDFRCLECNHIFDKRVSSGTDAVECEECGGWAERIWLKAPGVIMRPDGYRIRPGEPGYSKLPKKDREVYTWQS